MRFGNCAATVNPERSRRESPELFFTCVSRAGNPFEVSSKKDTFSSRKRGFFMEITIRQATIKDFETIQKLNAALFESDSSNDDALDLNWPNSEEGIAYYKKSLEDPEKLVLVAEDEKGEVVGYLIGNSKEKWGYRTVKTGELENMFIMPLKRRQGVGRLLVEKLLEWLKEKNVDRVYVSAFVKNTDAFSFYLTLGFSPWETGMEMKLI